MPANCRLGVAAPWETATSGKACSKVVLMFYSCGHAGSCLDDAEGERTILTHPTSRLSAYRFRTGTTIVVRSIHITINRTAMTICQVRSVVLCGVNAETFAVQTLILLDDVDRQRRCRLRDASGCSQDALSTSSLRGDKVGQCGYSD